MNYNDHNNSYNNDRGQSGKYYGYGPGNNDDEVSIGKWISIFILLTIPIVNLIALFILAFGDGNRSLKNFAKASLILAGISLFLILMLRGCSY